MSLRRLIAPPDPGLLAALTLSLLALVPLLGPGFIGAHDAVQSLYRAWEFQRVLASGEAFPRWAPDFFFGYGYPFFHFYAPLAFYLASGIAVLTADLPAAVEATFAVGFLLSAWGMYLLARDFLCRPGALLAAVAYVYFPYHLVDAHFRGDLSEFLALSWFPFILWGLSRSLRGTQRGLLLRHSLLWAGVAALFYALLILTHNVMALIFSPILVAFGVVLAAQGAWRKQRGKPLALGLGSLALSMVLGQGMAAFFWLPALAALETVQGEHLYANPLVDYRTNFPERIVSADLIQGYGWRTPDAYAYAVQVGQFQLGLAILGAFLVALSWLASRTGRPLAVVSAPRHPGLVTLVLFCSGAIALFLFLMHPSSLWLWERIPLMNFVQFPWRFLAPLGLATAFLSGAVVEPLAAWSQQRRRWGARTLPWGATFLIIGLFLGANLSQLRPRTMVLEPEDVTLGGWLRFELLTQSIGTTSIGEYLPRRLQERPVTSPLALDYLQGREGSRLWSFEGAATMITEAPHRLVARTESPREGTLVWAIPAWAAWQAYRDGTPVPAAPWGPLALLSVAIPAGSHTVELRLEGPPLVTSGRAISIAALAFWALGMVISLWGHPSPHTARSVTPPVEWALLGALAAATFGTVAFLLRPAEPLSVATPKPLSLTLGNQVELLGYELTSSQQIAPDQPAVVRLRLFGRALQPLDRDYQLFVHLIGITGQLWAQYDQPALSRGQPTSRWGPGEVISQEVSFRLPTGLPPGLYLLRLGLYDRDTLGALPITAERLVTLPWPNKTVLAGPLLVGASAALPPAVPLGLQADNGIALLGYDPWNTEGGASQGPLRATPGSSVRLTLHWKATERLLVPWVASLQLFDDLARLVAQQDQEPALGAYPTTAWQPGPTVLDRYELPLPADLPRGRYALRVVLYEKASGRRALFWRDGLPLADHPAIAEIVVAP